MTGLRITREHLRSVPGLRDQRGYCVRLSREWFKRYGMDFRVFLRDGIAAETLEATGDAFALRIVEHARRLQQKESTHGR